LTPSLWQRRKSWPRDHRRQLHWAQSANSVCQTKSRLLQLFSPYDLNPGGSNPLRGILVECLDFERLGQAPMKLFVTATNVRTGQGRVFRNREITPDVLLASACLPTIFQAVEIDGENYWDGGYSGNPTITPLVRECTYPAFAEMYARARELRAHLKFDELPELAQTATGENYNAVRLQVDTWKWVLSKMLPRVYGDKLTTEIGLAQSLERLVLESIKLRDSEAAAKTKTIEHEPQDTEPQDAGPVADKLPR
jgi:Patatin-like phospholipase